MAPKTPKNPAAAAVDEPAAKKAREEEPKKEEPVEEKFQEPDAPKDNRPALTGTIGFQTADTTLNVVPTLGGKLLTCLTDGGMASLIAGARANAGLKAGRYMFEAKIIQATAGKPLLRVGFSTSESGLVMGEDASSVYFDSEGHFVSAKKRTPLKGSAHLGKGQVVAVVLNLDAKSPNANTIALYKDGVAVGSPQPLPEDLKGKTLFPHVAYRSVSLRVNFGGDALKELPFKCRMLQAAAASDVSVSASKEPKDGKYEVCMPVAFPDEGTFDWLDGFLEKNPQYVELSDRKILQWAKASGLQVQMGKGSNDKPLANSGMKDFDDMSVRKVINALAPVMPRSYLIMEVKSNLIASERQETLKKFNYPCYKKVARVIMGEPSKEYKAQVQNKLLKDKQKKIDNQHKAKVEAAARKKQSAVRQKEIAKQRKEAEQKRQAAAKVIADKKEEEKKAKEGDAYKEPEKKDEPVKEPEVEEEKEEAEEDLGEAPVAELTDDEKTKFFLPKPTHDLTQQVMSSFFAKFSTPEKDEGFDDIVYEWQKADKAKDYLKTWVLNKKLTTRLDNIKPGTVFKAKVAEFAKLSKEWQDKLKTFKAGGAKKAAKKADEDADDIDIFSVADVADVGKGVPLFDNFTFEDWMLMTLRFEFCLLVLSFKVDANDPDRAGIPIGDLPFYFQKYFSKNVATKPYGVSDITELLALVKDTVTIKNGLLTSTLSDDLENLDIFLKLTEEQRRERQRRIDAGDETARLHFVAPAAAAAKPAPAAPKPATATPAAAAATKAPVVKVSAPVASTPAGQKGKGKK